MLHLHTTRPPADVRLIALFVFACLPVFVLDLAFGRQVSPWLLYAAPVGFAGWLCGCRFGFGIVALVTTLIAIGAMLTGHPFDSWWHFTLSLLNLGGCLAVVAWLAAIGGHAARLESLVHSSWEDSAYRPGP